MAESAGTANLKLIDSLVQVILALSEEEQALLEQKIQQQRQQTTVNVDQFFQELDQAEPDPHSPSLEEISQVVREVRRELWTD